MVLRRILRADRWSAYRETITDDAAGREVAAGLAANPTMRAMLGPPYDLLHVGGFTSWRVGGFVAMMAAVMAGLGVIRATRADEEAGRTELLRAGSIGRHAPLLAALLVALGLGIGVTGVAFAGVGAVAAQLTASARTARGIAMGSVGAAYLLRAVADGTSEDAGMRWLGWLSPLEWSPYVRPYAGERWWVLALPIALAAGLIGFAFALEARRDHGAGLRPARPGPEHAAPALGSVSALARRLDRGTAIWTLVGMGLFALVMGSMSNVFDSIAEDPTLADRFRRMGAGATDLTDAFYVAMIGILVVLFALIGISLVERLRREEESGRGELLLAGATSRSRVLSAFVLPALIVPIGVLILSGLLMALPAALRGDPQQLARIGGGAAAQAPGIALIVGLAVAVHGLAPRLRLLPWLVTGWSLVVNWIGAVLGFPQRVLDATPFAYLPRPPAEPMDWVPVVVESLLALGLLAAGWWGYARRDVT
ncbi:putative multidrug ABC transporter permease protein [Nostocoides australiense Ben110]|uniref:Putative multidrug ABC transporter permease protein n=1 Tax=Nostocoides australiense Ben110 TaxID=1193182 RepID=W6K3U7_9MICO|nr:putative multidrug ABC transporter permease protein [Tetrasphaera australiensis Ben110]